MRQYHREQSGAVAATPPAVFAFIDDHARLSSHMKDGSWMMGGGRMAIEANAAQGQAVGSHIRLAGRVFGVQIFLDEVVIRRDPPQHKVWETVGTPQLLVIGAYRMGSEIIAVAGGSKLRVFIDYDLPSGGVTRLLGWLLGGWYATWCVRQMLESAVKAFASKAAE